MIFYKNALEMICNKNLLEIMWLQKCIVNEFTIKKNEWSYFKFALEIILL